MTDTTEKSEAKAPKSSKVGKDHAPQMGPGDFEPENHFYPRALNAQIHSLVQYFFTLTTDRLVSRYLHLNPNVDGDILRSLITDKPNHFRWSGADLFCCTSVEGVKRMVLIETNSCPSGQKSMPLVSESDECGSYRVLLERTFRPYLAEKKEEGKLLDGVLAVVYDKNPMEATGYAAVMAEVFDEQVYMAEWYQDDPSPSVRFDGDILQVKDKEGVWHNVRAAFRYVTQRPWTRLPASSTGTLILNPVAVCLAGGRNKMTAQLAYELFNASHSGTGLQIRVPETKRDVSKSEVPFWVQSLGGHAVVKVPYSNAGQGVYTITNEADLKEFLDEEHEYDSFVVQALIGNSNWSSRTTDGAFFHVGTVPDKFCRIYVADLRMMVHYDLVSKRFRPAVVYGRRALRPLVDNLDDAKPGVTSWDMLGTNLSIKTGDDKWDTDTNRLLLFDRRDFNKLGISLDDMIEGFVQTVLATVAIDRMASQLVDAESGTFNVELFNTLNKDDVLVEEVRRGINSALPHKKE